MGRSGFLAAYAARCRGLCRLWGCAAKTLPSQTKPPATQATFFIARFLVFVGMATEYH